MKKARVLILDKHVIARRAVASVLQAEGDYEVFVSDDFTDYEKSIRKTDPDVLILDIEQMEKTGLSNFIGIKEKYPELPIIILAGRTEKGAELALFALKNGAIDFITKPEQNNTLLFAGNHLKKRVVPMVALCLELKDGKKIAHSIDERIQSLGEQGVLLPRRKESKSGNSALQLVTLGTCMGGPDALFRLLPELPEHPAVPIVIVQHFPKYYVKHLAAKLNKISKVRVEEAYNGIELLPGTVWLVPGGHHAEIHREGGKNSLKLHKGPRENMNRPSIDVLFRSASKVFGKGVLGMILSGWGEDGIQGTKAIREKGGLVWVQDPRTALSYALPLSIVEQGEADQIYPIEKMGQQLRLLTERKLTSTRPRINAVGNRNMLELDLYKQTTP